MTKTALENKRIDQDRKQKELQRKHEAEQNRLERNMKRDLNYETNKTNLKSNLWGNAIKATGNIGGALLKMNDPKWYKNYIKDLDTMVNIPTYDRLGAHRFGDRYALLRGIFSTAVDAHTIPGIMIIPWIPVVGSQQYSNTYFNNPVNQSLARMKEKVLALNSRSNVNWEGSDLGYNLFATSSIIVCIEELGRVIKVYQTYRATNAYLAKALITALGWSYTDIETNFAEYRKTYKILATKFNKSIIAPIDISLYSRRAFLAMNIFVDSENASEPRQMYAYRCDYHHILDTTGEVVACNSTATDRSSIVSFRALVNLMIARITENPDFIEMYQDLRHAFGDRLIQLAESVDGMELTFNNDPLNREQIHNLKTLPVTYNNMAQQLLPASLVHNNFWLRQDTNGYLYQGGSGGAVTRMFTCSQVPNNMKQSIITYLKYYLDITADSEQIFNMHKDTVSGDEILDITRWAYAGRQTWNDNGNGTSELNIVVTICGTELAWKLEIWDIDARGTEVSNAQGFGTYVIDSFNDPKVVSNLLGHTAFRSAFDWAPIVHYALASDDDVEVAFLGTFMDARRTFAIGYSDLQSISDPCVMSELFCPDLNFIK